MFRKIDLTHWEWELHRENERRERLTRQIQRHEAFVKRLKEYREEKR